MCTLYTKSYIDIKWLLTIYQKTQLRWVWLQLCVELEKSATAPCFLTSDDAKPSQDQLQRTISPSWLWLQQQRGIVGDVRHSTHNPPWCIALQGLRPQLGTTKHAGMLPGNVTSTKIYVYLYDFPRTECVCEKERDSECVCVSVSVYLGVFSRGTKGPFWLPFIIIKSC